MVPGPYHELRIVLSMGRHAWGSTTTPSASWAWTWRCSPTSTELRLPTRIDLGNAVGLGFFGLIVLLFWGGAVWIAWNGPQRSIGLIVVASAIAIALLFALRPVMRWLRYGADVTVTPDLLVVKHHWTSGERSARFHLHQVQLEEGRREIVVAGSRLKTRIGSGLNPEARRTVVEFLSGAIAGHLHPAKTSGTATVRRDRRRGRREPDGSDRNLGRVHDRGRPRDDEGTDRRALGVGGPRRAHAGALPAPPRRPGGPGLSVARGPAGRARHGPADLSRSPG